MNERENTVPVASLLYGWWATPPIGSFRGRVHPCSARSRPLNGRPVSSRQRAANRVSIGELIAAVSPNSTRLRSGGSAAAIAFQPSHHSSR